MTTGLTLLPAAALLAAAAPEMNFVPVGEPFAPAAAEYRRLWCVEGGRIVAALEATSGFPFPSVAIDAFVSSAAPMTALDGRTMWLRASYPEYYKRATLVHELGHRLAFTMKRPVGLDDHRLLNLFLFDAWTDLYGRDFAERMVGIERRILGRYDYAAAWDWALAMTRDQRQARLAELRPANAKAPGADTKPLAGCATG
jgi:hypothetical protein